jgi:threonine/homoserine/homoserine lactone efflux protein
MTNIAALIVATLVLILIPGPNVALIVANSLRHGLKSGLITALGTTAGIALQLFLVVAGMATVIEFAASALLWIKWLGVAYLVYLGIRTWNEPADDLAQINAQSQAGAFWRGLGFAVINPKTLLFNAAFLPQFIAGANGAASELFLLATVFLSVIVVGDAMWAVYAASARNWLNKFGKFRNKVTGSFLFGAGIGLALSRRSL